MGEVGDLAFGKIPFGCSVENRCEKFQEATWEATALVQLRVGSSLK